MTIPLPPQAPPTEGAGVNDVMAPMQPPVMPWTPFTRMPTDTEPENAKRRRIRLGNLIDSAKFEGLDPVWQSVAIAEYEEMRTIESQAAQAAAQAQQPQGKPEPPKPGASQP